MEGTVQEGESTRRYSLLLCWALLLGAGSCKELEEGVIREGDWEADVPGEQPKLQVF